METDARQWLCHALSKRARRALIELLLVHGGYSMRGLARLLGVTPPAIKKYRDGTTHPRDDRMCIILDLALENPIIRDEAKNVIVDDVRQILIGILSYLADRGLLTRGDIESLERVISTHRLSLLGSLHQLA